MWVRVPPSPMNDITEFQRESYRIDEQIWNALALRPDERAIFLGLANDGAWVARAVDIGVDVTVVASTDAQIAAAERAGASAMRGSATMIAATEGSYDVAVAMHYLHEIDPGFHGRVVSELARVARRVAIVEPSPPADPLGKRIAALYSRAKREGGQFEGYQTIDYWRKLLAIVKAEVWQKLFTFTKVPPRNAVAETVSLVLDAMAIEDLPQGYLDELRAIAARPDAQLLPLSRIVLVGTAAGVALGSGTVAPFRKDALPDAPVARLAPIAAAPPAAPPRVGPSAPAAPPGGWHPEPQAPGSPVPGFGPDPDAPIMPPVIPLPVVPAPPPPAAGAPFGAPFALPGEPEGDTPFGAPGEPQNGFGWSWEPPEEPKPWDSPGGQRAANFRNAAISARRRAIATNSSGGSGPRRITAVATLARSSSVGNSAIAASMRRASAAPRASAMTTGRSLIASIRALSRLISRHARTACNVTMMRTTTAAARIVHHASAYGDIATRRSTRSSSNRRRRSTAASSRPVSTPTRRTVSHRRRRPAWRPMRRWSMPPRRRSRSICGSR